MGLQVIINAPFALHCYLRVLLNIFIRQRLHWQRKRKLRRSPVTRTNKLFVAKLMTLVLEGLNLIEPVVCVQRYELIPQKTASHADQFPENQPLHGLSNAPHD